MIQRHQSHRRRPRSIGTSSMAIVSMLMLQRHSKGALAFGIRKYATSVSRGATVGGHTDQGSRSGNGFCRRQRFSTLLKFNEALMEDDYKELLSVNGKISPDGIVHRPPEDGRKNKFRVTSPYEPTGDQPQAIERLVEQVSRGDKYNILRGITGTGKTHVMAHLIARLGRPALVLCHNKTLAAQLARELRSSLRNNHVQLFVSYYDHYVPESYNEVTNKYTSKKSSVNDELDALRHLATKALVQHSDVVIVASVSCIYGMGMPKSYLDASLQWTVGQTVFESMEDIASAMHATVYTSSSSSNLDSHRQEDQSDDIARGQYQLSSNPTGATLILWPPSESYPMRVDFDRRDGEGYCISNIAEGTRKGMTSVPSITIFPAKHHLTDSTEQFEEALMRIQDELQERVKELKTQAKHLEADRLSKRVSQDLQMLRETGTCSGVENYSRHMALREAGEPPDTLLGYFGQGNTSSGQDWLLLVDESHVTLPQLKAMYSGDRSRKERLVKHGFRLPSALDNRPLREDEFWERVPQSIFVSATPAKQELDLIKDIPGNKPVDMIIRPTYVCDPEIHVRPKQNQLDDLLEEIRSRASRKERSLAIALTKRDAEDLADYLIEHGIAATYIHSGLNTHDRSNALKSLQSGNIDCLVGVNLLREGLDLPQVSFVAVLNADSEGFLRSETALLQTIGRAARHVQGTAILYANRVTESMQKCIDATRNRRQLQLEYNEQHGKVMKSTMGSSVLSIFDLLKDEIGAERPSEVLKAERPLQKRSLNDLQPITSPVPVDNGVTIRVDIITDHVPSKPGVYLWKDIEGIILYIGKAKRLRSRVKSYLSPKAKHSTRIRAMLKKANNVEFVLTPSDRDALLLESNLIKHHQPAYNVLLKDDEAYPYICASIGDAFPQLTIAPRRHVGDKASKYKYFGPYPHFAEINNILQAIEEKYDLRSKSFQARYGDLSKAEYQILFQTVLSEVFESKGRLGESSLPALRSKYEEASNLFESEYNQCRDVVVVGHSEDESTYVAHVLQLRQGLIAGQFSYTFEIESGLHTDEDFADAIETILNQQHYPSGESAANGDFSFFPDEVLTQYPLLDGKALKETIRSARNSVEPDRKNTTITIRTPAARGPRKDADKRSLQCALENAEQIADQRSLAKIPGVPKSSVDGTASLELAELLSLDKPPERIECYDISHTQGDVAVASRVVFLNGRPAPHLYRRFNIQTVEDVDDYASLEEALERRFRHVWVNGEGGLVDKSDPWAMPDLVVIDGGKGQLSSALKGMAKASVYPWEAKSTQSTNSSDTEVGSFVLESEYPVKVFPTGRHTHVPVVALAKNQEEVFTVGSSDPVNESPDSAGLLLLRALRDESHRFALRSHRRRRSRANGF